jgi:SAM-dependent methyltransferase
MAASRQVLDVGCGSSRILLDLPSAVGLDIPPEQAPVAVRRRSRLVGGTCLGLPFRDASFDGLISSSVIEHVPDDPGFLREAWRVLRPGGILALGTPDYGRWLWWALEWVHGRLLGDYAHAHVTHFTRRALAERLAAGLRVTRVPLRGLVRDDLQGAQSAAPQPAARRLRSTLHHAVAMAPRAATRGIAIVA